VLLQVLPERFPEQIYLGSGTLAAGVGSGVLFVCAAWLVITIELPMTNANTTAKSKIVKRVTFLFVNIWRIECRMVFS
jgi:hypothetical protein